jgi:ribosomal protein L11 methyltransferase
MTTTVARLACDEPTARKLAAALGESLDAENAVCGAFEGDGGQWQVAIHFRDAPDEAALRALVALSAGETAAAALIIEPVAEADWVAQSLAGLGPVAAGRFTIHGAHDRGRVAPNRIGIEIEAALAFGTGHHGTTRGCLLAIDQLAKRRRRSPLPPPKGGRVASVASRVGVRVGERRTPPRTAFGGSTLPFQGRDKRVLDLGTGTGILAIAAAKGFRTPVTATDIDASAIAVARGNARLNRVGGLIAFTQASGCGARFVRLHTPYDLVLANILLAPLVRMAAPLARLLAPGGRVVLSGLLRGQANAALAIYRAQGLALERHIALDGWVTLVMTRGKSKTAPGREPGRLLRGQTTLTSRRTAWSPCSI